MNKKITLLLASLGLCLTSCNEDSMTYIPKEGGKVEPEAPKKEDNEQQEENFNDDAVSIYEFYFDFSHSDEPLATIEGPTFSALGNDKIPECAKSQEALVAAGALKGYTVDPAFPTFIGWSFYGCCLDDEDLWDFSIDHKQLAVIPLYGIWVSK